MFEMSTKEDSGTVAGTAAKVDSGTVAKGDVEVNAEASEGLASREIIWIVIGVILVVVLICFLVWFFWYRKKHSDNDDSKKGSEKVKGGGLYKDTYFLIDMNFPGLFTWEFVDFVADVYKKFFEKHGKTLEESYQNYKKANPKKCDKPTFKEHFNNMCIKTLNKAFTQSKNVNRKASMDTFLKELLEDVRKCVYIHEHDHNIPSLKRFIDIDSEGSNQEKYYYDKSQKKEAKQMECQINKMIESINDIKKNDKSIVSKVILKSYDMGTLETYLEHMKSSLKEMSKKTDQKPYVNSIKTNYDNLLELSKSNSPANYSQERMYKLSDFYQCFIDPNTRNYNNTKITNYHEALLNVCVNNIINEVCKSLGIAKPDSICVKNGEYIYQSDHIQKGTLLNVMGYDDTTNISDGYEREWITSELDELTQASSGTHDDVYPASLQRNVLFAVSVLLSIYQYGSMIGQNGAVNNQINQMFNATFSETCDIIFKTRFKIFALNIFINSISKGSINAAKANSFEHSFKKPC